MKKYKNENERRLAEAKRISEKAKNLMNELESQGFKVNQYTRKRIEDVAKRKRFTKEQLKELKRMTSETQIRKGANKYVTYRQSSTKDLSFRVTAYKTDEQIAGKSYDMVQRAMKKKEPFGIRQKQNSLVSNQMNQLKMFYETTYGDKKYKNVAFDWDLKERDVNKNLENISKKEYINAVKYFGSIPSNQTSETIPESFFKSGLLSKEGVKVQYEYQKAKGKNTFMSNYKSKTGKELTEDMYKALEDFFRTPLWQEWRENNRGKYDLIKMIDKATVYDENGNAKLNFEEFEKAFVYETVDDLDEGKTIFKLTNLLINQGFLKD